MNGHELPAEVVELLAAVAAALDVPHADAAADDETRADLLHQRASDARIIVDGVVKHRCTDVADSAETLREWTAEHPVTYKPFKSSRPAADPDRGMPS